MGTHSRTATIFVITFFLAITCDIALSVWCTYYPLVRLHKAGQLKTLSGWLAAITDVADSPVDIATWNLEKSYYLVFFLWMYSPRGTRQAKWMSDKLAPYWAPLDRWWSGPRAPRAPFGYPSGGGAGAAPEPDSASLVSQAEEVRKRYKTGRWWVRRFHDATMIAIGLKVLAVAIVGGLETERHPADVPVGYIWAEVGVSFFLTAVERVSLVCLLSHWQRGAIDRLKKGARVAKRAAAAPASARVAGDDLRAPLLGGEGNGEAAAEEAAAGPSAAGAAPSGSDLDKDKDKEEEEKKKEEEEGEDLDLLVEKKAKEAATLWALVKLSATDAPQLVVAFTAGVMAAFCGAFVPYYLGHIIKYASIKPSKELFQQTTLKMLLFATASGIFTGIRGGTFSFCMTKLNVRIRKSVFASIMRQEIGWFDVSRTGDITSRLSSDTSTMADQISLNLNIFLRSLVQAIMVLVFMFTASWRLTAVTCTMVPISMSVAKIYGTYFRRLNKATLEELAGANSVAEEALSSMSTVRSFAGEEGVKKEYGERLDKFWGYQNKEAIAYSIYATVATVVPSATTAAVLYVGGLLVLDKRLSPENLVSFMLYQQVLTGSFQAIGDVFGGLTSALGAADKVFEILYREPKMPPPGEYVPPGGELRGEIALSDVVFSYPGRPEATVLKGLSVRVKPGEVVALVGPSGGGKSSIVKLIEWFYSPQQGGVTIDGRPVGEFDQKWLKRRIGLVGQEPVLYARSIRRNILYALEGEADCPTDQEVEAATRLANAYDFITSLPKGFDTECGEKGVQMSGGQKQRIAISRALVRRPRILLLDEATSALDADSESVVQEALDSLMASHGHTVLVVAHRLSTIKNADRIVVVSDGVVKEEGTHDQLLAVKGSVYGRLVRKQLQRRDTLSTTPSLMDLEDAEK